MTALLLAALLSAPARAASPFLENLRRAETRDAKDPERVEYATRALRAWREGDGRLMLAAAHLRRAEGLLAVREEARAVEDLTKALENDPANHAALRLRAQARLALGKALDAENDYAAYSVAQPEDAEGWVGLARARLPDSGAPRPEQARKAAARARRRDAEDWRPDWLEGRSYRLERRPEAALAPLGRAVALAKGAAPEPFAERAAAAEALGRLEDAAADWGRVIPAYARRHEDARRTGAPPKTALEARSALADAHWSRGRLREFLLQAEGARADYEESCGLGRADACAKLKAAPALKTAKVRRPKEPAPPKDPPERKRPRPARRRAKPVPDEAGERIYAH